MKYLIYRPVIGIEKPASLNVNALLSYNSDGHIKIVSLIDFETGFELDRNNYFIRSSAILPNEIAIMKKDSIYLNHSTWNFSIGYQMEKKNSHWKHLFTIETFDSDNEDDAINIFKLLVTV